MVLWPSYPADFKTQGPSSPRLRHLMPFEIVRALTTPRWLWQVSPGIPTHTSTHFNSGQGPSLDLPILFFSMSWLSPGTDLCLQLVLTGPLVGPVNYLDMSLPTLLRHWALIEKAPPVLMSPWAPGLFFPFMEQPCSCSLKDMSRLLLYPCNCLRYRIRRSVSFPSSTWRQDVITDGISTSMRCCGNSWFDP